MTVRELRKLRTRIRHTVNLVGSGERIGEVPGTWWRANMLTRTVEWTPTWPFKPYGRIDELGILYCVAHEASHLKWSGLYETKRIPEPLKGRFHRFVNAIEDIRVDRLSARQYALFRKAKVHTRLRLRRAQLETRPEGWNLVDVVAMNAIYSFDIGEQPFGSPLGVEASRRLWPRLNRIANLASTQEVATALEPIFLELVRVEAEEAERKRREEEQRQREEQQRREEEQRRREEAARAEEEAEQAEQAEEEAEEEQADDTASGSGASDEDEEPEEDEQADGVSGPSGEEADEDEDDADESEAESEGESDGDEDVGESEAGEGEDEGEDDEGEGEDDEDADPLDGLDALADDAGADKPTDTPVKSDGDPGTEPMAFGDELPGMADDAEDPTSGSLLRQQAHARKHNEGQQQKVRDLQLGQTAPPTLTGRDRYDEVLQRMRGSVNALANRIKSVLRQNAMDNPSGGHRRGRLDTGKAWRAAAGNPRIFRRPGSMGGLDYTFGLLVDTSDSMFTRRFDLPDGSRKREIDAALEAMVLVAEALDRAGLGVFVVLWDTEMRHVKPLADPLARHRPSLGHVFGNGGSSTYEAPALGRALEEFSRVREGRRMLITITDGETRQPEESKELLADLAHAGVDTVTIRIGGRPASHYQHGYRVEHADELVQLLPRLINQVVRRGS